MQSIHVLVRLTNAKYTRIVRLTNAKYTQYNTITVSSPMTSLSRVNLQVKK